MNILRCEPHLELLDGADSPSVSDVEDMSTDEDEESDEPLRGPGRTRSGRSSHRRRGGATRGRGRGRGRSRGTGVSRGRGRGSGRGRGRDPYAGLTQRRYDNITCATPEFQSKSTWRLPNVLNQRFFVLCVDVLDFYVPESEGP